MLPELQTPRLTLRLARPGMEAAIAAFLGENFPGHLDRWSPPAAPAFFTAAFWADRLAAAVEEFHADRAVRFVLQARPGEAAAPALDAPVLGTCNYTNIVRGAFQACHLGYQIARDREGSGMMGEALRCANEFMFDAMRLHRIMANYRPENARSARLLERLGFRREGLARDYLFIDGKWCDHVLTSLVHPRYDDAWLRTGKPA
jgi:ribosomal-protein-alanine N-acetyltransferase